MECLAILTIHTNPRRSFLKDPQVFIFVTMCSSMSDLCRRRNRPTQWESNKAIRFVSETRVHALNKIVIENSQFCSQKKINKIFAYLITFFLIFKKKITQHFFAKSFWDKPIFYGLMGLYLKTNLFIMKFSQIYIILSIWMEDGDNIPETSTFQIRKHLFTWRWLILCFIIYGNQYCQMPDIDLCSEIMWKIKKKLTC